MQIIVKQLRGGDSYDDKYILEIDEGQLGHEIALGIRSGLFGIQADETASIKDFNDLSDSVRDHAEGIILASNKIADALNIIADALHNKNDQTA